ncbi:unnamed protein product, partial [Pocillopora meandrina]
EEDLSYFEDDDEEIEAYESGRNVREDSVNEDWSGFPNAQDSEEDFEQNQSTENADEYSPSISDRCGILVFWLLLFLVSWQSAFFVTDSAVEMLLKFLSRFLGLLGTFDENGIISRLSKRLPSTLYKLRKNLGLLGNDEFIKYVVCPKCKNLYDYKDCIQNRDRHLMEFCHTFEELCGKDLVTPNMHLHGHLKECLLDYGPFHSFWCFSFERFNGILGSFHTNNRSIEIQLMRKFLSQTKVKDFEYPEMFQETFLEFFEGSHSSGSVKDTQEPIKQFLSLRQHREISIKDLHLCDWTASDDIVEMSTFRDETLDTDDLTALESVYKELLGLGEGTFLEMPHTIAEFKSLKVGSVVYGSSQSQTTRNSFVLANWAGHEGRLACSSGCNDVRPGQVISFFFRYMFYFARVNWYSVHPERFSHGVPVEIWCNSFDLFGPACFMPVQ